MCPDPCLLRRIDMSNAFRICVVGNLMLLAPASILGQTTEVRQSGVNTITIKSFAPRDLTDPKLRISKLNQNWNTDKEIRWDLAAIFALLSEQAYNDDDEAMDFLLRGMGLHQDQPRPLSLGIHRRVQHGPSSGATLCG